MGKKMLDQFLSIHISGLKSFLTSIIAWLSNCQNAHGAWQEKQNKAKLNKIPVPSEWGTITKHENVQIYLFWVLCNMRILTRTWACANGETCRFCIRRWKADSCREVCLSNRVYPIMIKEKIEKYLFVQSFSLSPSLLGQRCCSSWVMIEDF